MRPSPSCTSDSVRVIGGTEMVFGSDAMAASSSSSVLTPPRPSAARGPARAGAGRWGRTCSHPKNEAPAGGSTATRQQSHARRLVAVGAERQRTSSAGGAAARSPRAARVAASPFRCVRPPRASARKVLGWPKRWKLARTFLWEYSCKRLELAQLLGQLGCFLTFRAGAGECSACTDTGSSPGDQVGSGLRCPG